MITEDDAADLALILSKTERVGSCMNYTGGVTGGGYGSLPKVGVRYRYYTHYAHRMVLSLVLGKKLRGRLECALHTCDNRRCVNPEHLFLGTYSDNAIDRESKGRGHNMRGDSCTWKGVPLTQEHRHKLSLAARQRDAKGLRTKNAKGQYK